MNARIARKIQKHCDWYGNPESIWGKGRLDRAKARDERANPRHRIFLSSLALAELLRRGRLDDAQAHWTQLRERIIKHWTGSISPEEREWGEGVAGRASGSLAWDVEYYSDRWCGWRVAAIDHRMLDALT